MTYSFAWRNTAASLLFTLLAPMASAEVMLRVSAPSDAIVGTTFAVQVNAEGLGDAGDTLALGAYDLDFVFDSARVSFASLAFGDAGGHSGLDAGVGGTFQFFTLAPDRIAVSEISLESEGDLLAAQPASFVLFTMQVAAITPGVWLTALDTITLVDQAGNSLPTTVVNAGVTIAPVPAPVPEPASLALVCTALLGMVQMRQRRKD